MGLRGPGKFDLTEAPTEPRVRGTSRNRGTHIAKQKLIIGIRNSFLALEAKKLNFENVQQAIAVLTSYRSYIKLKKSILS